MTPQFSVIIPTYNRGDILKRTLDAYRCQTAASEILEILIVDDGSTDGTDRVIAQSSKASPFPIRYLSQDHKGPAKGRNRAIRESKGALVLMGDDDIIPGPGLVAEHLAWHQKYPAPSNAVLGYVTWSPEVNPTPFMQWLGEYVLFDYGRLQAGQISECHFYSCNISLKRNFLLQNGLFDEEFPSAAFEDIELGHRLAAKGLRLFYNPDAVGFHFRKMSVADARRRAEVVEASYGLFIAKTTAEEPVSSERGRKMFRKTLKKAAQIGLPVLSPIVRIFDTQVPLPWIVYRLFYFNYLVVNHAHIRHPIPEYVAARGESL